MVVRCNAKIKRYDRTIKREVIDYALDGFNYRLILGSYDITPKNPTTTHIH